MKVRETKEGLATISSACTSRHDGHGGKPGSSTFSDAHTRLGSVRPRSPKTFWSSVLSWGFRLEAACILAVHTERKSQTILFFLCGLDPHSSGSGFRWTLPKKDTQALTRLSTQEACHTFGNLLEAADPADSLFGRRALVDIMRKSEEFFSGLSEPTGHEVIDFLCRPLPRTVLLSYYSDDINPFVLTDLSNPAVERTTQQIILDYYGSSFVFSEAIRQQLTQGMGLLCSFWFERRGCCFPRYKALLENIWSCTSPDAEYEHCWRRMGCLS